MYLNFPFVLLVRLFHLTESFKVTLPPPHASEIRKYNKQIYLSPQLRFFQSLWNFGSTSATTEKKPVGDSPRTPTISTGSSSRDTAPLTLKVKSSKSKRMGHNTHVRKEKNKHS